MLRSCQIAAKHENSTKISFKKDCMEQLNDLDDQSRLSKTANQLPGNTVGSNTSNVFIFKEKNPFNASKIVFWSSRSQQLET